MQSKSMEEMLKVTFEIRCILLFVQESKERNRSRISTMYKWCYKIHYKNYWYDFLNPKNYLNNTWRKSTTIAIELKEEIKFDTFHLHHNRRLSNQHL